MGLTRHRRGKPVDPFEPEVEKKLAALSSESPDERRQARAFFAGAYDKSEAAHERLRGVIYSQSISFPGYAEFLSDEVLPANVRGWAASCLKSPRQEAFEPLLSIVASPIRPGHRDDDLTMLSLASHSLGVQTLYQMALGVQEGKPRDVQVASAVNAFKDKLSSHDVPDVQKATLIGSLMSMGEPALDILTGCLTSGNRRFIHEALVSLEDNVECTADVLVQGKIAPAVRKHIMDEFIEAINARTIPALQDYKALEQDASLKFSAQHAIEDLSIQAREVLLSPEEKQARVAESRQFLEGWVRDHWWMRPEPEPAPAQEKIDEGIKILAQQFERHRDVVDDACFDAARDDILDIAVNGPKGKGPVLHRLSQLGDKAHPLWERILLDPDTDWPLKIAAANVMVLDDDVRCILPLIDALGDKRSEVKVYAAERLAGYARTYEFRGVDATKAAVLEDLTEAIDPLRGLVDSPNPKVQGAGLESLGRIACYATAIETEKAGEVFSEVLPASEKLPSALVSNDQAARRGSYHFFGDVVEAGAKIGGIHAHALHEALTPASKSLIEMVNRREFPQTIYHVSNLLELARDDPSPEATKTLLAFVSLPNIALNRLSETDPAKNQTDIDVLLIYLAARERDPKISAAALYTCREALPKVAEAMNRGTDFVRSPGADLIAALAEAAGAVGGTEGRGIYGDLDSVVDALDKASGDPKPEVGGKALDALKAIGKAGETLGLPAKERVVRLIDLRG